MQEHGPTRGVVRMPRNRYPGFATTEAYDRWTVRIRKSFVAFEWAFCNHPREALILEGTHANDCWFICDNCGQSVHRPLATWDEVFAKEDA